MAKSADSPVAQSHNEQVSDANAARDFWENIPNVSTCVASLASREGVNKLNVAHAHDIDLDADVKPLQECDDIAAMDKDKMPAPLVNNLSCVGEKNSLFAFLHWNVNGLLPKLSDSDFVSYLMTFDFVCLTETFLDDFQSTLFAEYEAFCVPAVKFSQRGRRSGGLVCLIKKTLSTYVRKLDVMSTNFCGFVIDKSLFGTAKDVLYVCSYVHPEFSPFYAHYD